jgi:NTP pyrophosphatase (non-canonical NTP hydrolase)
MADESKENIIKSPRSVSITFTANITPELRLWLSRVENMNLCTQLAMADERQRRTVKWLREVQDEKVTLAAALQSECEKGTELQRRLDAETQLRRSYMESWHSAKDELGQVIDCSRKTIETFKSREAAALKLADDMKNVADQLAADNMEAMFAADTLNIENDILRKRGDAYMERAERSYRHLHRRYDAEWQEKMVKELGDVAWYAVNMATLFQMDATYMLFAPDHLEVVLSSSFIGDVRLHACSLAMLVMVEATKLAEVVKKAVFHGHGVDSRLIMQHTTTILKDVQLIAALIGTDIETVFQRNVEKLAARYPEKFETFLSINKNESSE